MKLRYVGGKNEKVLVGSDPKVPNKLREVEKDQLSQVFEGTTYLFPAPGAVMSVPPNIGGWLLGKHKKFLVEIPDDPAQPGMTPNVITGTVPVEKPASPAK